MALRRDELNETWIPYCDICTDPTWEGTPEGEQGKAQTQYLNHCKTPEHKENKKKKQEGEEKTKAITEGDSQEQEVPIKPESPEVKKPEQRHERKPSLEDLSETEILTMHGEEGRRFLKRRKLEQLLSMAPDMSDKILKWVMENYDQDEMAKRDVNALYTLLLNCKVKVEYAGRIIHMIMAAEQKWINDMNGPGPQAMFFQNPQGQPGGQSGYTFFDMYGRPVPQNFNQPAYGYPQQYQGFPPNQYPSQYRADPTIEEIKKTVSEMAKTIQLLQNPPKSEITKQEIIEIVGEIVADATKKPELTKEDMIETVTATVKELVVEKEKQNHLEAMVDELKALRGDITRLENRPTKTPVPKDISEEGSIEVKKLEIIGDKLGDIHETVKHGMSLLMQGEEKPKPRTGEDISRLDEDLDRMAVQGG